jgi:hypothetical protein
MADANLSLNQGTRWPRRQSRTSAQYAEKDDSSDDDGEDGPERTRTARTPTPKPARKQPPEPSPPLNEYELERLENIRRNHDKLLSLGLVEADAQIPGSGSQQASRPRDGGDDDDSSASGAGSNDDDESDVEASGNSSSESDDGGARAQRGGIKQRSTTPAANKPKGPPARARAARSPALAPAANRVAPSAARGKASGKAEGKAGGKRARKGAPPLSGPAGTVDAPIDLDVHDAQARAFYNQLNPAGRGLLTAPMLAQRAMALDIKIDLTRAQQMIDVFDANGKGGLNLHDIMMIVARPDIANVFKP